MSKKRYKDLDKYYAEKKRMYNSYYKASQKNNENKHKKWDDTEISLIMEKNYSDGELSKMLGRSIGAIQGKRYLMKKEIF